MTSSALALNPSIYPALQTLQQSRQYILGALSNTIIFPPGQKLHSSSFLSNTLRQLFDVFISAHVGLRKPDPGIYRLAVTALDDFARDHADSELGRRLGWSAGVQAHDILFLDDIGENLRAARVQGFGTMHVRLGRTYEAVEKLEQLTGLKLGGHIPRCAGFPDPKSRYDIFSTTDACGSSCLACASCSAISTATETRRHRTRLKSATQEQ